MHRTKLHHLSKMQSRTQEAKIRLQLGCPIRGLYMSEYCMELTPLVLAVIEEVENQYYRGDYFILTPFDALIRNESGVLGHISSWITGFNRAQMEKLKEQQSD